jgi:predicted amidophosphoribosyltransferase
VIVVAFATYLTRTYQQWTQGDFNAYKFIRAIKNRPIKGWAWIPVSGASRQLSQVNAAEAVTWFAEMAVPYLQEQTFRSPVVLVPMPGSSCSVDSKEESRAKLLAQAITPKMPGFTVWDGLRWKNKLVPSSQGGPRDPRTFYQNLVLTSDVPAGSLVFIDDVFTSGSHIVGVAAKLREHGTAPELAVCAGRTVHESPRSPFSLLVEYIPDFDPNA